MMIPVQATVIPQYILINKMGLGQHICRTVPAWHIQCFRNVPDATVFHEHPESVGRSGLPGWGRIYKDLFPDHASLAKTGLAVLAVTSFMGAWNDFLWPLLVSSMTCIRRCPLFLSQLQGRWYVDWSVLMAATLIKCDPDLDRLFVCTEIFY